MIRIAICDDIPQHLDAVSTLVREHLDEPYTLDSYSDANSLFSTLERQTDFFDLLLVDIDLGSGSPNGIDLARQFHDSCPDCQIIFITGYTQYVSAVYEVEHVYLVTKEDLAFWLPRALRKAVDAIKLLRGAVLSVTRNGKIQLLPQKHILYCERIKRTTHIISTVGEYPSSEKLDTLMEQLKVQPFTRCHKSFLVNIRYVKSYQREAFLLENGAVVPISRGYSKKVREDFHKSLSRAL